MFAAYSIAASGFAPTVVPARAPAQATASPIMAVERSAAIPFLKRPPALDGSMVGDRGFDPLGISTTIIELGGDLNYVREAELMHGRQSMIACVGFIFPAVFGKLPTDWNADVSTNPIAAQYELPPQILAQLLFSMAIAEGLRAQIIFKGDREPGDHGFDPLGFIPKFCNTPEKMAQMKEAEMKHCRIAMIAITGFWFQLMITGEVYPIL
mmetsp:Transcript_13806/g.27989  ORF Transcript_13806/g.27989 Transcript_13806/m.27989 type:complete len:210 (+) Transcript_13806:37-666(+)